MRIIQSQDMLDSPWHLDQPGGPFLQKYKDNFFFDNYLSALGRTRGYLEANTNIYLTKSLSTILPYVYGDPHGYSYEWYRSSITDFSDPDILGDFTIPPVTLPYGFYWFGF